MKQGDMIKIGIIKEGKNPPDKRVVLTPEQCKYVSQQFSSQVKLVVEPSAVRVFRDEEYREKGVEVSAEAIRDCDYLLGVKEVPIDQLIPDKTCFFFSHTIKEQPYNRDLLRAVLNKRIRLIDWECLTEKSGGRILGFGRYAGVVGAYNGLLTYGKKFDLFNLKPAHECHDRYELEHELHKLKLPPIKIALTGRGRVARGAREILERANIKEVTPEAYLENTFSEPVYTQLGVEHYNKPIDPNRERSRTDFFENYAEYESDFERFQHQTDLFIAGHFYAEGSPALITKEQVKHKEFRIQVIADISCDIAGPVATTIKPSTIEDPVYGVDRNSLEECDYKSENAVAVMAVDNLPCELPRDASFDFGKEFIGKVLPHLINGDSEEMLKNGTIAQDGELTERYAYLSDYVKG